MKPLSCLSLGLLGAGLLFTSCREDPGSAIRNPSAAVATKGRFELTARLLEIPPGAIFKRDLYDYATILKYEVLEVHRGHLDERTIYVGHYNPWKSRAEAADARAPGIGGSVRQFASGQIHRLALEAPLDDFFMGGIVNQYFGQTTNTLYWAVWTDAE